MAALWMDLNGRVACADHIGAEAAALLAARPQSMSVQTTMTVWEPDWPLTDADRADIEQCEPTCESCDTEAAWYAERDLRRAN